MKMWTDKVYCVRFEVITTLLMKIQDLCDMTPRILVNVISVVLYARTNLTFMGPCIVNVSF
jgi:hypothetical protein